ncbi:hypothetical protein C9F11_45500 (plasmid) [Streptomyces sp. YIM 121038]|uniref:hypothetical protein n=1 Tax=Streptomyces sp. YIM 121038 TaxID=2136401 RepID=UPI00110FFD57|nr:hypothetical protein [Streptomyces sp. YIM 121038]QCX82658.1 hypothetical protein C9F11_45500 [Streptomyces sp. YIM 121038]
MRKTTTARRVSASVLLASTLVAGLATQGNAFAIDYQEGSGTTDTSSDTIIDLPYGDKWKMPTKLPGITGFKGLPELDDKLTKKTTLQDAAGSPEQHTVNTATRYSEVLRQLNEQSPGMKAPTTGKYDLVVHNSWDEESLIHKAAGRSLTDYCGQDANNCGFTGRLIEAGPKLADSGAVTTGSGKGKLTVTEGWNETKTRTETRGFSIGGTVELSPKISDQGGKGGFTFTYNRSTTDAHAYGTTRSVAQELPVPSYHQASGQSRFVGGVYAGYIAVVHPAESIRVSQQKLPLEVRRMAQWSMPTLTAYNTNDIVELYPMQAAVKAPGKDLPTVEGVMSIRRAETNAPEGLRSLWKQYDALKDRYNSATDADEEKRIAAEMDELIKRMSSVYESAQAPKP